jgi:hypothetical protein
MRVSLLFQCMLTWELACLRCSEGVSCDFAMLAAQVTSLASLWGSGVTWRIFTTLGWIQMSEGTGTVAITWNRCAVDMVH